MRKHGLTVDNLLAAEVVTADGSIVRASADEHPDLFWALRGGGGNFGVVTAFRFALHPLGPTVMAGPVFWAADDTIDVLGFYREFVAGAHDELGTVVRLGTVPPFPGIPEDLHWRPPSRRLLLRRRRRTRRACCARPSTIRNAAGGPGRTQAVYGPPGSHRRDRSPRVALLLEGHEPNGAFRRGHLSRCRSRLHRQFAPLVRGDVPHGWRGFPDPSRRHCLRRRDVAHNIVIEGVWLPEESGEHATAETAWARGFLDALEPHREGVYVNFLDSDDDTSRVREAYGDRIYRRLAKVKAKYDPDNAFHHNKNIPPG